MQCRTIFCIRSHTFGDTRKYTVVSLRHIVGRWRARWYNDIEIALSDFVRVICCSQHYSYILENHEPTGKLAPWFSRTQ
jgi:hypothetical protein